MSTILEIKVIPRSGRNKWILDQTGILKCYLKRPPERGLANKELIKILAKALSIKQSDIQIVSGATGRKKRLKIAANISFDQILSFLGIERQIGLFDKEGE